MAQISQTLYNTIAQNYAAIDDALSGVTASARDALDAIVDVDTLDYPEAGSNASADAALEIELALLQVFNNAYVASANIANSNASLLDAVSAVNDFVITNKATGTAAAKMLAWINTDMSATWTDSYCPDGWANVCRDAGYSVVGWSTVLVTGGLTE